MAGGDGAALPTEATRCQRVSHIDRRWGLTQEEFFQQYALPNKPVVLCDTIADWPALRVLACAGAPDPVGDTSSSTLPNSVDAPKISGPDLHFLEEHFGSCSVPVSRPDGVVTMPLTQFVSEWRAGVPAPSLGYCKDWHFVADAAVGGTLYRPPACLGDDWLNAYCDTKPEHCFGAGSAQGTQPQLVGQRRGAEAVAVRQPVRRPLPAGRVGQRAPQPAGCRPAPVPAVPQGPPCG
eukprot:EG_transcript_27341